MANFAEINYLTNEVLRIVVICNEDDEISFLLKNRISFMADCHYEHRSLIYDGKSDKLLIAQNFGKQAEMSGGITSGVEIQPRDGQQALVITTGKEYIKKYQVMMYLCYLQRSKNFLSIRPSNDLCSNRNNQ
jgi:hypothetical protein